MSFCCLYIIFIKITPLNVHFETFDFYIMLFYQLNKQIFLQRMLTNLERDPFEIIKNYRKMVARRDRHHKKRRPKNYPPTNMKTRSMEQKGKIGDSEEIFDWDHYSEMIVNSSQWQESRSPQLLLLDQNDQDIERSMDIQALSLGQEELPLDEKSMFYFWNNEVNNDLNQQGLLQIH